MYYKISITRKLAAFILFLVIITVVYWMVKQVQPGKNKLTDSFEQPISSQLSLPFPKIDSSGKIDISVKKGKITNLESDKVTIKDESYQEQTYAFAENLKVYKQGTFDKDTYNETITKVENGKTVTIPNPPVAPSREVSFKEIKKGDEVVLTLRTFEGKSLVTIINDLQDQ